MGASVQQIAWNSSNLLYSITNDYLYKSNNNGISWNKIESINFIPADICFAKGNYVYIENGNGGVARSSDAGLSWNLIPELGNNLINSVSFYNDSTYIALGGGLYISTNNGTTFTFYPTNSGYTISSEVIFAGDILFAQAYINHIPPYLFIKSSDFGRSWYQTDSIGFPNTRLMRTLLFSNNIVFAGFAYDGLYRSTDNGKSWGTIFSAPDDWNMHLKSGNGRLYFQTLGSIYVSTNSGNNWSTLPQISAGHSINCIETMGSRLFAGLNYPGVYRSSDHGLNWTASYYGMIDVPVSGFYNIRNYLYAGTKGCGIFKTYNGFLWQKNSDDLSNDFISSLYQDSNRIYSGFKMINLFRSTNNGTNWTNIYNDSESNSSRTIEAINAQGNDIFFGSNKDGLFRSTDFGVNWYPIQESIGITSILRFDKYIFYSDHNTHSAPSGAVFRSSDNGITWEDIRIPNLPRSQTAFLEKNNGLLFAISKGYFYKSINYGSNWIKYYSSFEDSTFNCIYINNGIIFCGTSTASGKYYIRYSNDNGSSFNRLGDTIPEPIRYLCVNGDYIYAAGGSSGVWRCPLSLITSYSGNKSIMPYEYSLSQNYPNPFNPTTNIRYAIPKSGFVKLVVFDMLGREVSTLVNEKQSAGSYETTFNASVHCSGVYFYRLTTDNYSETKKMILLK
jgi:photosystem II stability/assembly factor-like uncharacterized protein